MKLRNLFIALVLLSSATALSAQTMTATAMASKAKAARSVANDLRHKRVQKATATVLKDKDVQSKLRVDKALQDKATNTNFKNDCKKAKADAKKDPVAFGEKSARDLKKYRKNGPKWMHRKSKKRSTHKK
jgi:hypothetical protein